MSKLSGEAATIWRNLSKKEREALAAAPKFTMQVAASAALKRISTPSDNDYIAILVGLAKGKAPATDVAAGITEIMARSGLSKKIINDWNKVAKHAAFTEAGSDRPLAGGVVVNEWDFSDQQHFIFKRLAQVHNPDHSPTLFRHGAEIAEIAEVTEAGSAAIDCLTKDQFMRALSDSVAFSKSDTNGEIRGCLPPDDLVKYVYNCRNLPIPYLSTLTRVPTMGADYKINTTRGYNLSGHVYYAPPRDLNMPELPAKVTEEDLIKARQIIVEEFLGDWPFDKWTRSEIVAAALNGDLNNPPPPSLLNTIGIALEQIVQPIIKGVLPPHLITKPTSRTGASNLANALQIVIGGSPSSMTLEADEASMEKKIVAALKGSTAIVLLDNVAGVVDSTLLAKWWTDPVFTGRDLGKSQNLDLPVTHSKLMTTNNATFSKELANRLGMVRLDANSARPDTRTGFRHNLILDWTRENRGEILWSLCVLAMHWVQVGKPGAVTPTTWAGGPDKVAERITWGGYESYIDIIGGIVGAAAPNWTTWQANRTLIDAVAESGEDDAVIALLTAWYEYADGEKSLADGLSIRTQDTNVRDNPKASMLGLAGLARENSISLPPPVKRGDAVVQYDYTPSSIGAWLTKYRDRPFEVDGVEVVFTRSEKRSKDGYTWHLNKLIKAAEEVPVEAPVDETPVTAAQAPEAAPTVLIGRPLRLLMTPDEKVAFKAMTGADKAHLFVELTSRQEAQKAA